MKVRDSNIDGTADYAQRCIVVGPVAAVSGALAGVKIASVVMPVDFEITGVAVTTVTDGGGNAIAVKVGANAVLNASIVPAAGTVVGVLNPTLANRQGAAGSVVDIIATTAAAGTWLTVTISYKQTKVWS